MSLQAIFFHAFNLCGQIGPSGFKKLLTFFKSPEKAWSASLSQFQAAGLSAKLANRIVYHRENINLEQEQEKLAQQNIELVTIFDEDYPSLLKEIYDAPWLLYARGHLSSQDKFSLAVVGTRKVSLYGQQVTPWLTTPLAEAGLTIVSGLAIGVDTLAHQSALEAGGRTLAVVGCGLSDQVIYPRQNKDLATRIAQAGAVISEFPPQTSPQAQFFPMRNRLIAGLSLGTLVIEAPGRSGALITARQALDQNREVFAVPGPIFAQNSTGTNQLIKMGALPISQANDILEELNLELVTKPNPKKAISADNPQESLILKQINQEPIHIDKIIIQSKLPAAKVNAILSLLEVKGKVRNLSGNNYILNN